MAKMLGRAFVKHDGKVLLTEKGAKLNYGGIARDEVIGEEVHGYSEKMTAPKIECTVNVSAETSLEEIRKITDATVTFECDTGQTYVLRNAWSSVPPEITAGEGGKIPVTFTGMNCEEMK